MKVLIMLALLAAPMAFAEEGAAPGTPDAAHPMTKMSKKDARKACKDEGKKGKDLSACVKEKTK